jgi:hypothetical protein
MVGQTAGAEETVGDRMTFVGHRAGRRTGGLGNLDNTFIGWEAGSGDWASNSSSYNTVVGSNAFYGNCDGANYNVAVGYKALLATTAGDANTMVGYQAGDGITTGGQNVGVGSDVAFDVDADNQIAIGYNASTASTGANTAVIGNTAVTDVYMSQDAGATVRGAKPQWADSSKKYYKLIGSKSLTADTVTEFMVVGHSHSYNITFWADSSLDGVAGFHRTAAIYGSSSTSEVHETTYGSGTDNISIAYLNSGGSQNYILRVTAASADCTFHYMIEGFGSQTLTAL